VTEPTELQLAVAHRGFVHLEVEVTGRAAHGSRPDLGIDAIAKMGRVLVGIEELDHSLRAHPTHPQLGSGSIHASLVEGGQEFSSYPARCVLQAERRTIPGETAELAENELREIVARAGDADPDFSAVVRAPISREPFEVAEDWELVHLVRRHATAVLGAEPELVGVPFWADSALLAAAGIPTVVFGPIGEGLHTEVEWVDVESLDRCVDVYVAVASELCA
jgi:acetylornithine deacetylase